MTKYLNFFESESGFTEAVEAGELFYPNVSYTEEDDTVHWNLAQPADPVETPMLRMHFTTSTPGEGVKLTRYSDSNVTAMEIDGIPVNVSGDTYGIAEPGNHTAVYQFASSNIPEGLFNSESGAFDTFTSAEITSAVTTVSGSAFRNCSGLSSVSMSDSVTSLGNSVFYKCSEMESATIGSGVTTIPSFAFGFCSSLLSVVLPDNLTVIENSAFFGCSSLYDINIPSGVTSIGTQAFYSCGGLTAIYFNSQVPPTLGTGALTNTNNCPIYVPAASVETYQQAWPGYASRITSTGGGEPDQYSISASVNNEELGQVNLDGETASEGDHVEFDVEVFEEDVNKVLSVTVTDGNGDEVECNEDWDNHYSFDMPDSDVTISVEIGEKEKTNYAVTVNSTDDLVTDVGTCCNEETGDWDWGYEGEPSFPEGEPADFAIRVPEGYLAVSAQASDCDGNSIDDVNMNRLGDDGVYECMFTMPYCDASVFITVEADTRPRYNISASVNDDSLGEIDLHQDIALEGETVFFDVKVFDTDANHVSSVTCTDGNGNEIKCWWDFDERDYSRYHINDMPASDVTIEATIEPKQ